MTAEMETETMGGRGSKSKTASPATPAAPVAPTLAPLALPVQAKTDSEAREYAQKMLDETRAAYEKARDAKTAVERDVYIKRAQDAASNAEVVAKGAADRFRADRKAGKLNGTQQRLTIPVLNQAVKAANNARIQANHAKALVIGKGTL